MSDLNLLSFRLVFLFSDLMRQAFHLAHDESKRNYRIQSVAFLRWVRAPSTQGITDQQIHRSQEAFFRIHAIGNYHATQSREVSSFESGVLTICCAVNTNR